jgi:hypothetical protein
VGAEKRAMEAMRRKCINNVDGIIIIIIFFFFG